MATKTIDQLTAKANPVDADLLVIADSQDNNEMKQITIGSITGDIADGIINDSSASSTTTYSSTKITSDIATATPDATIAVKGKTLMSVAPASAASPIAVGDNDGRVPTQGENDALVGTSGTPSTSNKYVTNDDTATTATANKVARRLAGGNITVITETTGNNTTNAASTAFVQQEILPLTSIKILKQTVSTGVAPNTSTNFSNATTISTGCSTTEPIIVFSQVTGAFGSIGRYIKNSDGTLTLTHLITSDVGFNGNTIYGAIIGDYIYACGSDSGGVAKLYRYNKADLTGSAAMTISGTAITRDVGWFSDGTQLYNVYTNGTARIYTISGTTATSGSTVSYTSSTATHGYWSDGTSVYSFTAGATYKWALAGGARTTGTVPTTVSYYSIGTGTSSIGGIFKENGNTTNILTCMDSSASVATTRQITFVPITMF